MAKGASARCVGAQVNAVVAPADRKRRTATRADQEIILALEEKGERESALETFQRRRHGFLRRRAAAHFVGDEMGDGFRVGLGRKDMALGGQLRAQFAEILDDAVMDHRDAVIGVRVGVGLIRLAMRRPPRVADADRAVKRRGGELFLEIFQLAAGAHAREPPVFQGGDAGRVIAAIFEPPQAPRRSRRRRARCREFPQCRT